MKQLMLAIDAKENEVAAATLAAENANNALSSAQAELDEAQANWDAMQDYRTRTEAELQTALDDAEAALAEAEDALTAAQDALTELQNDPEATQEQIAEAEQAATDAQSDVDTLTQARNDAEDALMQAATENDALIAEAQAAVDAKQAEADRAAESLDNSRALMEAQKQLNNAQRAYDAAVKAAEENPTDAQAQANVQMTYNSLKAAQSVRAAVANVSETENGTAQEKALAQQALAEALAVQEQVERANDYIRTRNDAAFDAQLGLDENATEEEKVAAALNKQQQALDLLDAIELYGNATDAAHTAQADATLAADKEELAASENAYREQQTLFTRQAELAAAQEMLEEAQTAYDTLMARNPYKQINANEDAIDREYQLQKRASTDATLKEAMLNLENARAAVETAENALAEQEIVLEEANAVLAEKVEAAEKLRATNAAIAVEDERLAALEAANDEKNELTAQKAQADQAVAGAEQNLQNAVNAAADLLDAQGEASRVDTAALRSVPNAVRNATSTNTADNIDAIAEQLYERLTDEARANASISAQILEKLDAVNAALSELYNARIEQEAVIRAQAENAAAIAELEAQATGNQAAINAAKSEQPQNLTNSGTTAQAKVDARDTAVNPNLRVEGDATVRTGGDFGKANGTLSTEISGKLDLVTEGEIGIASDEALNLDQAQGSGDVTLTSLEGVESVTNRQGAIITGEDVELNAITGSEQGGGNNVGGNKQLVVNATGLGGTADNIQIKNLNTGNTELSDLTAKSGATLNMGGSVTQQDGAVLAAESLALTAQGSIGVVDVNAPVEPVYDEAGNVIALQKPDGAVAVNAQEAQISGSEANIYNIAPSTEISISGKNGIQITALGNLTPGSNRLNGQKIAITAIGNIGTPLNGFIYPNGAEVLTLVTFFGLQNVTEQPLVFLMALRGGALGFMSGSSILEISDPMFGENEADAVVAKALQGKGLLVGAKVTIREGASFYKERIMLMLKIEGTEDLANGDTVYVLHSKGGSLELMRGFVWEGYVVFFTNGLDENGESNFVAVTEEALGELGLTPDDFAEPPYYPFGAKNFSSDLYRSNPTYLDRLVEKLVLFAEEQQAA